MRKLIAAEYVTLDGIMESPETWQFPYLNEEIVAEVRSLIQATEASLLGRVTYQIYAAYWPTQTHNEFGFADKMNQEPKFVVSSTLDKAEWNHTTLIAGNAANEVRKLKQQPGGNIRITGSATLVQSLMAADLIDEYHLLVHPVVLGTGKRLFAEGLETTLNLIDTKTFSSGVVALTYQPDRSS